MKNAEQLDLPLVSVDRLSDVPIYLQIRDALSAAISRRDLPAGARLPPIRTLAKDIGVNIMTVARAYKELTSTGVIAGRGALGSFVATTPPESVVRPPSQDRVEVLVPSRLRETQPEPAADDTFRRMLEIADVPGMIPLTRAYPDASVGDMAPFERSIRDVLDARPDWIYSYSSPDGLPELRQAFCELLFNTGVETARATDIVVTNGAQQSISLIARQLLRPGDVVITERPTYFGALDLFRTQGVRAVGIDLLEDGPDLDQFEEAIVRERPKLAFLMPTFHNPTGVTTSLEKRRAILELSRRYSLPIIEDDHCPEIRFEGVSLPPIKALADPDDLIYYIRGMGKVFVPGVRLGFVAPPRNMISELVVHKAAADLHTSPLLQAAFVNYLGSDACTRNVGLIRDRYKRIQKLVAKELRGRLPPNCTFKQPQGGFNIWVDLPPEIDVFDLYFLGIRKGVACLMSTPLHPDPPGVPAVRVSYGLPDTDLLTSGIERLCASIREVTQTPVRRASVV